jgi:hypothetical protein
MRATALLLQSFPWWRHWFHTGVGRPMAPTSLPSVQCLRLLPAQDQLLWLLQGAVLHLHHGQALLTESPQRGWPLAWRQTWTLEPGQVWVAARPGWLRLTAGPGRCELSARLPAGPHCRPPLRY